MTPVDAVDSETETPSVSGPKKEKPNKLGYHSNIIGAMVECVEFLGRQEMPLRGHREHEADDDSEDNRIRRQSGFPTFINILPTPRSQRAAQATTIAPR